MLIMETYDGDIETLHLEYHDMDENSWSDNCAELVRELNDGGTCVMAAITADTEYSPRIIAYFYRMDE